MTTETLDELRRRMLDDADVRAMIRARAFEIYRMRGLQPGSAPQDWFQAESEVLAFLLAHADHVSETEEQHLTEPVTTEQSLDPTTPKKRKPRSTSPKTSEKKTGTRKEGPKKAAGSESKPRRTGKKPKSEDKAV